MPLGKQVSARENWVLPLLTGENHQKTVQDSYMIKMVFEPESYMQRVQLTKRKQS